ncbi:MAG TPA: bifunctional folylpolyglutamate synthase/dihydrofolate synthase [Syntrophaceae bacterium]|jgi:dihydrofolate synthase/folylpolyglutamate synthase|nr:bifunctional folylpolyglutamate synthase/dihydrofolate synthase [Syntrophaceae bacterium]
MQDPLERLCGLKSVDIRLCLGPISRLLNRLDNPYNSYRTILVGGTNGKGSIAAMVASVLNRGGFRVGLYTSPHLIDIRERIKVNNSMISIEEMHELIREVKESVTEDVTYFEFLTTVAFLYFSRKDVDIAVLEVGMGGRLDATNVVTPLVSVISNISFDHEEYLGGDLRNISQEKGGIIKDKGICITAVKQKSVIDVLEDICSKRGAGLLRIGRELKIKKLGNGFFTYRGISKKYERLMCPLKGAHQIENAAVALGVIEVIATKGFAVNDDEVFDGIRDVRWEGRLEVLRHAPMLLVDGAHNTAGVSALSKALKSEFSYKNLILIFGVLKDKRYRIMLKKLVPLADRLIITKPVTVRAMPVEEIVAVAQKWKNNDRIEVVENSSEALKRALSIADSDDLICVTGSLYLVGEIKRVFSEIS